MKCDEHFIQKGFLDWLDLSPHRGWRKLICATPNGARRSRFQGMWLKAEGMKAGWPDMTFAIPTHDYPGLFIEFKRPKGRLTPDQKIVIADLEAQGYLVHVCYSWETARDIFIDYIKGAKCTIMSNSEASS